MLAATVYALSASFLGNHEVSARFRSDYTLIFRI
jgi:hypothetical protein